MLKLIVEKKHQQRWNSVYKSASIDGGLSDEAAVDGLTIATNGDWEFDPSHASYDDLAFGQSQIIEVTYEVKDASRCYGDE